MVVERSRVVAVAWRSFHGDRQCRIQTFVAYTEFGAETTVDLRSTAFYDLEHCGILLQLGC